MKLKIKRLTDTAKLPVKNNPTDAGFDIFTDEDITINVGEVVAISTGITLELPSGYYARLVGRSGLTLKTPLKVLEGVIDSDYRVEVKVMATIQSFESIGDGDGGVYIHNPHTIRKETKIAQLIIQELPNFTVEEVDELQDSDRGENGFGSSGIC